jgi:hypothetical protein
MDTENNCVEVDQRKITAKKRIVQPKHIFPDIHLRLGMCSVSANTEKLSLIYRSVVHWSTDYTDNDSTDTQYLYQQGLRIEILSADGIGVSVVTAPVNH